MKFTIPYLMFSGNCQEALEFYKSCLERKITRLTTIEHAPFEVPEDMENRGFDAEFRAEGVHFKASDDMPGHEVNTGTNFALFLASPDAIRRKQAFEKLSEGGKTSFPLDDNFGTLTDKFKIQWIIAKANT